MNIKELSKKYNLTKEDYWLEPRSKKWIITHDTCEKIASVENIIIQPPQIINSEKDLVRMIVVAKKGDKVMWADGEADSSNCKNNYKFAMASKRAIDRVILKLINAYEWGIYSDVEADSFAKPQYEHRTEEQAKEFEELKGHPAFDGLKKFSNDEWKKCTNVKEYESVLERMREEKKKFDEINQSN
tara:strand:+ start:74 stop:631 length:558 start_codon:yes stop_codon:yes gene_type:complete